MVDFQVLKVRRKVKNIYPTNKAVFKVISMGTECAKIIPLSGSFYINDTGNTMTAEELGQSEYDMCPFSKAVLKKLQLGIMQRDGDNFILQSETNTPTPPGGVGIPDKERNLENESGESGENSFFSPPSPPPPGGESGDDNVFSTFSTQILPGYTCAYVESKQTKNNKEYVRRRIIACVKPIETITTADLSGVYIVKRFDVKYIDNNTIYDNIKDLRKAIGKHPTNEEIYDVVQKLMDSLRPIEKMSLKEYIERYAKDIYEEIKKDALEWVKKKLAPLGEQRIRHGLAVILTGVSTFIDLDYKFSTVHSGLSASGKSTTIDRAIMLFPPVILRSQFNDIPQDIIGHGVVINAGYVTPKSLIYLNIDWTNKVLVIGQLDDPENLQMLHSFMVDRMHGKVALTVLGDERKETIAPRFRGKNPTIVFSVVLKTVNRKNEPIYNSVLIVSYDPLSEKRKIPDLFTTNDQVAFLYYLSQTPDPILTKEVEDKVNEFDREIQRIHSNTGRLSDTLKAGILALAKIRGHKETTLEDYEIFMNMYRTDAVLTAIGIDIIDISILQGDVPDIPLDEYEVRINNLLNQRLIEAVNSTEDVMSGHHITYKDKKGNIYTYVLTDKAKDVLSNYIYIPEDLLKQAYHDIADDLRCTKYAVSQYFMVKGYYLSDETVEKIMKSWGCNDGALAEIAKELLAPDVAKAKCRDTVIMFKLKEKGIEPTKERIETIKTLLGCGKNEV